MDTFDSCSFKEVHVPGDIKTIGDGTFSEKDIKGLVISVETEWGKIDKVFSKAGVAVSSAPSTTVLTE